eukprot:8278335-Prorocentrum_lima.AAC.1
MGTRCLGRSGQSWYPRSSNEHVETRFRPSSVSCATTCGGCQSSATTLTPPLTCGKPGHMAS